MSNIFAKKTAAKGDKVETDFLGGGGVLSSDIYGGTIKYAYMSGSTTTESQWLNVSVMIGSSEVVQKMLVIKGDGEVTYKDKKTGELKNLPGYNQANALFMLLLGKDITDPTIEVEEKILSLYDFDAKKELPRAVDCYTDLHDVKIQVAVQSQIVDKTKKNETTGEWDPTGETRNQNEIIKFFHEDSLATLSEIEHYVEGLGGDFSETLADGDLPKALASIPDEKLAYAAKWLDKNRGEVYDKSTANKNGKGGSKEGKAFGGAASSGGSGGEPKKKSSLFD